MAEATPLTEFHIDVIGSTGVPFRVVLDPGYLDYRKRMVGEVTFYDARYRDDHEARHHFTQFTQYGQKVSWYAAGHMADHGPYGLDLQGDVPAWKIGPTAMTIVSTWVAMCMRQYSADNGLRWQTRAEIDLGSVTAVRELVPLLTPITPYTASKHDPHTHLPPWCPNCEIVPAPAI